VDGAVPEGFCVVVPPAEEGPEGSVGKEPEVGADPDGTVVTLPVAVVPVPVAVVGRPGEVGLVRAGSPHPAGKTSNAASKKRRAADKSVLPRFL